MSSPSRATLFTGLVPRQHGILDSLADSEGGSDLAQGQKDIPASFANQVMLSDLLSKAGYGCGYVGKWSLGNDARPGHGFSHTYTLPPTGHTYTDPVLFRNGERVQEKGYLPDLLSTEAERFLRSQPAGKPWFLTVSFLNPHLPYTGHPQKYYDLYAKTDFETVGWQPGSVNARGDKNLLTDIVGNIRKAAASLTALDDQIPKLTKVLSDAGARDNTLILFTSDHGSLLGRHGLWGKGLASDPVNMYDEVVQVPMLWAWPGRIPAEAAGPEMVSFYDVLPTVADLLGLPLPQQAKLCGRSFAPSLLRRPFPPKQPWENLVFGHYRDTEMARDRRYKLVLRDGGKGPNELYDLTTDRGEQKNEYDNPSYATVQKRLTSELGQWRQQTS
jgi:arylsulfatase A-like enzyme